MGKKIECYCAFCKTPRRVYFEKSLRLRHFFWSFMMSLACSFLIWGEYDPKSLLFCVVGLMTAEVFTKIRWRIHLTCRACGFDPVLYVKNPDAAATRVKEFLKKRQEDPDYLLRRPLNLPARPRVSEPDPLRTTPEAAQKISAALGSRVSRTI
ncbi:MAG: hypothetical protein ACK5Y2_08630 [Bdellovibrionales bacterium]